MYPHTSVVLIWSFPLLPLCLPQAHNMISPWLCGSSWYWSLFNLWNLEKLSLDFLINWKWVAKTWECIYVNFLKIKILYFSYFMHMYLDSWFPWQPDEGHGPICLFFTLFTKLWQQYDTLNNVQKSSGFDYGDKYRVRVSWNTSQQGRIFKIPYRCEQPKRWGINLWCLADSLSGYRYVQNFSVIHFLCCTVCYHYPWVHK